MYWKDCVFVEENGGCVSDGSKSLEENGSSVLEVCKCLEENRGSESDGLWKCRGEKTQCIGVQ